MTKVTGLCGYLRTVPTLRPCVVEQRHDTPLTAGRFTNPVPWQQACRALGNMSGSAEPYKL